MFDNFIEIIKNQAQAIALYEQVVIEQAEKLAMADSVIEDLESDMEDVKSLADGMKAKIKSLVQRQAKEGMETPI